MVGGGGGAATLAVISPIGVGLLDVFCSGVRFYVLLGPCLCFWEMVHGWVRGLRVGQASVCLGPHLDEG